MNKDVKTLTKKNLIRILLSLYVFLHFTLDYAGSSFCFFVALFIKDIKKPRVLALLVLNLTLTAVTGYFSISQIKKGWNNHDVKINLRNAYIIKNMLNNIAKAENINR